MKNKKVTIKEIEYELIRNDDCYNQEDIEKLVLETDYFDNYDYILGDYAYEKLKLKGFYESDSKKKTKINDIKMVDDYIKDYCQYGSKIFLLKKIKKTLFKK